ncbi:O-antigen ligase [Thalassobacillus cyri]|uniref:O-antigen ligase n=1 Tax=Thalassobacillus cyri TaxID=571932 RepID=A0A1H4DWR1_9BACI|nr:O-antigen ligase family protein [Thalassobacillus cyri]SEA77027.1 O-antigen ligase [Thalassobacillus cyri]
MNLNIREMAFFLYAVVTLAIAAYFDSTIVSILVMLFIAAYTWFHTKNSILMLFIYFPIRPFLLEFSPTLKGIGDIIVLISLMKVFWNYRKNWKQLFRFDPFEIAFILFCVVGSISALLTGVSIMAIVYQLRALVIFYLVYYIVKRLDITTQDVKKFVYTIIAMVVIIGIHGLIEKISGRQWLLPESWVNKSLSVYNENRIYGMPGNPNSLAVFLSLSLIILIFWKTKLTSLKNFFVWVPLVLLLTVMTLTYSRGAWISLVFVLITYTLLTKCWGIARIFLISLVAAIILVTIPYGTILDAVTSNEEDKIVQDLPEQEENNEKESPDRFRGAFDETSLENSSRSGRLFIVKKGFEIYKDHPIIGTGFGTFGDSASLNFGSPLYKQYDIEKKFFSDNQYIQIIVQTGTIGVLLFAVFLLNMLWILFKKRKETHLAYVLLCVLLGSYVAGLVYNIWEYDIFTLIFFTMLAYLLNTSSPKPVAKVKPQSK